MAARDSIMTKPKDTKGTLRRMLSYLKEYRPALAVILFMCAASNVLALIGPAYAGNAINEAQAGTGLVNFE